MVLDMESGIAPRTRALKRFKNPYVNQVLSHPILENMDGELVVGPANASDVINRCGELGRHYGEPDFYFHVFDIVVEGLGFTDRQKLLWDRVKLIRERAELGDEVFKLLAKRVVPVYQTEIENLGLLDRYESACLLNGYEGVMLRSPHGAYKFGRSTVREGGLVKVKRFVDSECEILEALPAMENLNEKEVNALGLTERSTKKSGKVQKEMIGRFHVRELEGKGTGENGERKEFYIGPGVMDHNTRIALWSVRDSLKGSIAKFKHFPHGAKDVPRHGSFLAFRSPDDM